ncbi:MAG: ferritin-like domain-containing protein [Chitinophagaceae bacterium]|nr:MAG: ferritin-like domain-containing protein [Chitinophagaceae bacterium]
MNNLNQDIIAGTDTAILSDVNSDRRQILKTLARLTGKLALSALPAGFSGVVNRAYGQHGTPDVAATRINHLILLEYLQAEFFETAVAKGLPGLATNHFDTFRTIAMHDKLHIDLLKGRLIPLKFPAIPKPEFDFTGGSGSGNGPYKNVFADNSILGAVARSIKDLAVRSYIAQYPHLVAGDRYYIGPINIHPVESRHAAQLRTMPFSPGFEMPWITRNQTIHPFDGLRSVYFGEENTLQDNIQIVNINGKAITVDHATEAFDEPLSMETVNAIIAPFIAG